MPRAPRVLSARSTTAMPCAATSQNSRRPLCAWLLRRRLPRRAHRSKDSPAQKRHQPRFPQANTLPAFPPPQSRFPICPSTPPPCVPPSCGPRREFSSAAPGRSRESPAQVPLRSFRSKSSAPESAPRRKPKAASQKNVFPARRQNRTAPAHLRAHGCGSGGSLRCAARRARRTSKAATARRCPRRTRPLAIYTVLFSDYFGKFSLVRWKVVEHAMHPSARGGVGIIHDERDALRICRGIIPFQLRGNVGTVAGKFLRDCFSGGKGRAGNLQGHCSSFLLGKDLSGRPK